MQHEKWIESIVIYSQNSQEIRIDVPFLHEKIVETVGYLPF